MAASWQAGENRDYNAGPDGEAKGDPLVSENEKMPPVPRFRRAGLVWALGLGSAFGPFAIDMYLPAFPTMAAEFAVPVGTIQFTLAVFLCGLAAGQMVWGTLADRIGRRAPLLAGCLLFTLASILCAVTPSIEGLILARFVMGLGGSAGSVVTRAIVRDLYESAEAARFYAMLMLIGGLAPIIAPILGSLLLEWVGWRVIFAVIAGIGALSFLLSWAMVPESLAPERRVRRSWAGVVQGYGTVLSRRAFLVPALALSSTFGILFSYITSSSVVFITVYGVAATHFGLLFGAIALVLYLGAVANRWLLARRPASWLLPRATGLTLLAALGLVGCAWSGLGGFPLFFALLLVSLSSLGLVFPIATAMAMQPFAAAAGTASALLGILQFLVAALAGALSGLIQDGTARPLAVQIALFALATWLLLRRVR